jgi:hypothetical protein
VLFTFPSRYLFTIGHQRVFSLTRWFWQIPTDFHLLRGTWDTFESQFVFTYGTITRYGAAFQKLQLTNWFLTLRIITDSSWKSHNTSHTRVSALNVWDGLDYFHFARRYYGNHFCFLFLRLLRCFTSPRLLTVDYEFINEYCDMTRSGLPHSEIVGSEAASALPTLIAGNRVLHRLLVPRHPPYALSNLTKNLCWYTDTSSLITRQRCIIRISDRKLIFRLCIWNNRSLVCPDCNNRNY